MKMIKKTVAMALAFGSVFSLVGCGGNGGIDTSKTQIYIAGYDGGAGNVWLDKLAAEWNATNDSYEVIPIPERISAKDLTNALNTGVTDYDVYFTGDVWYQSNIYNGTLEDLSDVGAMEVDGAGNGTILEKLGNREDYYETTWKPIASKYGEGLYMLPYGDNFGGLIFDYDTFVENNILSYASAKDGAVLAALEAQGVGYETEGARIKVTGYTGTSSFFNYEVGDYVLTAGKDGKYGTYDDGQPITETEWVQMLGRIVQKNMKPFLWTGGFPGYVDMIVEGMFAYYAGLDAFQTYYDFDGEVIIDGQKVEITPDNGYEVYGMDAMEEALEFVSKYLNDKNYYHAKTEQSLSHTETQGTFILGYQMDKDIPAMLVEGNWWENEARSVFNTPSVINASRGYGERDYRYMLLPQIEGAYGLDGNGGGSVFCVQNSGAVLVPKVGESEAEQAKLAQIKDFLGFMLKDENLIKFTQETGITNAYDYELSKEQLESVTPFARNVHEMIRDKENIGFARGMLMFGGQPIRFATTGGFFTLPRLMTYNKVSYEANMIALRQGITPAQLMEGATTYYSHGSFKGANATKWEDLIAQAREQGFYTAK